MKKAKQQIYLSKKVFFKTGIQFTQAFKTSTYIPANPFKVTS